MATLTAVKFPTASGADDALEILERLQREEAITVHDGAIVTWATGAKKPKTRQLNDLAGAGALGGGFWGLLFGLIFFVPILGLASPEPPWERWQPRCATWGSTTTSSRRSRRRSPPGRPRCSP